MKLSAECRERASYLKAMEPEGLSTIMRQSMETMFKAADELDRLHKPKRPFMQVERNVMTAWLIEMTHNDAPMPRYWNPSKFKKGWVWDANEAIRFCREQDARDFLDGHSLLSGKPVEHIFIEQAAAA